MKKRNDAARRRLKAEIREKRREISRTAEEIKDRFSPPGLENAGRAVVKEEIMERTERIARSAGNTTKNAGEQLYEVLCDNLFATAMVGVGVAWLTSSVLSRLTGNGGGSVHKAKETLSDTAEAVGEKAQEAADRAREKAESFAEEAESVGERAEEEVQHAAQKSKEIVEKNPLYVGGALFAIGALIGLSIPTTRRRE